jgi:hypothetical protein
MGDGKVCGKAQMTTKRPLYQRKKSRADWKKDMQACGEGIASRKRPTLVVGQKPNGKSRLSSPEIEKRIYTD